MNTLPVIKNSETVQQTYCLSIKKSKITIKYSRGLTNTKQDNVAISINSKIKNIKKKQNKKKLIRKVCFKKNNLKNNYNNEAKYKKTIIFIIC